MSLEKLLVTSLPPILYFCTHYNLLRDIFQILFMYFYLFLISYILHQAVILMRVGPCLFFSSQYPWHFGQSLAQRDTH